MAEIMTILPHMGNGAGFVFEVSSVYPDTWKEEKVFRIHRIFALFCAPCPRLSRVLSGRPTAPPFLWGPWPTFFFQTTK